VGDKEVRRNYSWTDREKAYLRENAPEMTTKELAAGLGTLSPTRRSIENVRIRCRNLGIKAKPEGRHHWTEKEDLYLKRNFRKLAYEKIAGEIGVTKKAIEARVHKKQYAAGGAMERATPWMPTMLEPVDGIGKNLYDISCEVWEAGRKVAIEENSDGQLAVFCRGGIL